MLRELELTERQKEILSEENVLPIFLYLLDGYSTVSQLSKKINLNQLQTSYYVQRLVDAGLALERQSSLAGSKTVQVEYEVVNPSIDLGSVADNIGTKKTLELLFNKVRTDVMALNDLGKIPEECQVSYNTITAHPETLRKIMGTISSYAVSVRDYDIEDGESNITLLMVTYRNLGSDL